MPVQRGRWRAPQVRRSYQRRGVTDAFALRAGGMLGPITIATSRGDAVRNAAFNLSDGPYPVVVLSRASPSATRPTGGSQSTGFPTGSSCSPDHDEVLDSEALWQSTVTRPREISTVLDYASKQAQLTRTHLWQPMTRLITVVDPVRDSNP